MKIVIQFLVTDTPLHLTPGDNLDEGFTDDELRRIGTCSRVPSVVCCYVFATLEARKARLEGQMNLAAAFERTRERYYAQLPAQWRW